MTRRTVTSACLATLIFSSGAIADVSAPTLVKDINPGIDDSFASGFTLFNGAAYFTADDGQHGVELWKTDGTAAGTSMVLDLRPGSANAVPGNITPVNGKLYFNAYDTSPATGSKVFVSDGTALGTSLLVDTFPGVPGGFFGPPLPGNFTAYDSTTVLFTATSENEGLELWKTNGTPGGTSLVTDLHPGTQWSIPIDITVLNGIAYFAADDSHVDNGDGTATFNRELFRTNTTASGTYRVKDINVGPDPSAPNAFVKLGNEIIFTANDGIHGGELWKTDGTTDGTVMVADINPTGGSGPDQTKVIGNKVYFIADDGTHGAEMWTTDGTEAGTHLVKDINPIGDAIPLDFTPVGSKVFFNADDGEHGRELWVTDGTDIGTHIVKDINVGADLSSPNELTVIDNFLFFTTVLNNPDFTVTTQLWMTDGTEFGTQLLFTDPGLAFGYSINNLTALGNQLLFMAPTGVDEFGYSINTELHSITVPEPATLSVIAVGAIGMMRRRRR